MHVGGCPSPSRAAHPVRAVTQALRSILRAWTRGSLAWAPRGQRARSSHACCRSWGSPGVDVRPARPRDMAPRLYEAVLLLIERPSVAERDAPGARGHALVGWADQDGPRLTCAATWARRPVLIARELPDGRPATARPAARAAPGAGAGAWRAESTWSSHRCPDDARPAAAVTAGVSRPTRSRRSCVAPAGVPLYLEELRPVRRAERRQAHAEVAAAPPWTAGSPAHAALPGWWSSLVATATDPSDARLLRRSVGFADPDVARRPARGHRAPPLVEHRPRGPLVDTRHVLVRECGPALVPGEAAPTPRHARRPPLSAPDWAGSSSRSRRSARATTCWRPVSNSAPCRRCCGPGKRPATPGIRDADVPTDAPWASWGGCAAAPAGRMARRCSPTPLRPRGLRRSPARAVTLQDRVVALSATTRDNFAGPWRGSDLGRLPGRGGRARGGTAAVPRGGSRRRTPAVRPVHTWSRPASSLATRD